MYCIKHHAAYQVPYTRYRYIRYMVQICGTGYGLVNQFLFMCMCETVCVHVCIILYILVEICHNSAIKCGKNCKN